LGARRPGREGNSAFSHEPAAVNRTTSAASAMTCLRPRHQQPDGVRIGLVGTECAHDLSAVHDNQPVAEIEQFVQVLRDEQDGGAPRPARPQDLARRLRRGTSIPRVG